MAAKHRRRVSELLRPHRLGGDQPQHPAAQLIAVHLAHIQAEVVEEAPRRPAWDPLTGRPGEQQLTGNEEHVEADVDRQEIELGDEGIPPAVGGLPSLHQQLEEGVPGIRIEAELFQFTDLALDGDGKLGPWPSIGQAREITVEWITLVRLVERHRVHLLLRRRR